MFVFKKDENSFFEEIDSIVMNEAICTRFFIVVLLTLDHEMWLLIILKNAKVVY
jgi:hypothetical protein